MRSLKVLLLFDLEVQIPREEYKSYLKTEEWKNEAMVLAALQRLGHDVRLLGLKDSLTPLLEEIEKNRPDVVFNLSEAFNGNRDFEPHLVALLELMKVPYTGCGPDGLRICKDKGLTKKILAYHHLHIPKFVVARKSQPIQKLSHFQFPAIIKPLALEASEGIAQLSLCSNEKEALERIRYVNEKLGVEAIVEEYIEGRELYVGILGNEKLTVFPPRELFFKEVPKGEPKFATWRAKWDEAYRKKWGIDSGPAAAIPQATQLKIFDACKRIYRVLQIRGYGRIDLRLREDGQFVFIEANPNPSIAKDEDFAKGASKADLDYDALIAKIISLSNC